MALNYKVGIFRIWLILTIVWVLLCLVLSAPAEFIVVPPLIVAGLLFLIVWAIRGFSTKKTPTRRAWVIAKGLLLRLHLMDGRIISIPMLQAIDDSTVPELRNALAEWCLGMNGHLDSLAEHPKVATYVENWALDRSHLVFRVVQRLSPDLRCVWVTPDLQKAWFLLPTETVVSVSLDRWNKALEQDPELAHAVHSWAINSPTAQTLLNYPPVLKYLNDQTPEAQLFRSVTEFQATIPDHQIVIPPASQEMAPLVDIMDSLKKSLAQLKKPPTL
jgi:hypothetical protein